MGLGKTYSTKYLLDSNNSSGAAGQVLISTSTGIDWSDGSDIIGGPYLPLSAGSTVPLTGALYLENSATDVVMSGNTSGNFTIDNTTGQIAFKAGGSTVQSMIITSSQISLNEAVSVNSTSLSSPNKLQVNGQARVIGQFMVGDSSAGNTAARPIHVKQSGAATIRLEDSDNDNLAFDLIVDEGVGFKIAETIGGDAGDDTRLTIHETSGNVSIGSTTEEGRLLVQDSGLGNTNGDSATNLVLMGSRWDLLFKQIRTADETDWKNTTVRIQGRVDSTNMQSIDFATDNSYNRHIDINTGSNNFNTRFTAGGNVGIGTVSPNFRLNLSNETALTSVYQQFTNGTTGHQSSDGTVMGIDADGDFIINNQEAKEIKLYTSDSQKVTIDSAGDVGIGNTSPVAKLDVGGSVQGSSFYNLANPSPIMFPDGGTYNGSSSETGYIVIKLPDTGGAGTNNMMTCLVRIFDYATNESFDLRFNGYFYGSGYLWTRTAVWIDSVANMDRNFTVRFGKELGGSGTQDRAVVTIGETGSTWSYPKVAVIQYTPGHSEGAQPQIWNSGWNVSVVADYWDGTDNTLDDTITNNQVNNWKRNGQDLYYGSGTGNVGIGVTGPLAPLDVFGAAVQNGSTPGIKLSSSNTQQTVFAIGNTGTRQYELAVGGTTSSIPGAFYIYDNNVADFRITLATSGNVGIGTTSPGQKLTVQGSSTAAAGRFTAGGNTNTLELFGSSTTGQSSGLLVNAGTNTADYAARFRNAAGSVIMNIRGDGNVGIGLTNPGQKLEVAGNIKAHDGYIRSEDGSTGDFMQMFNDGSNTGQSFITTSSTELVLIPQNGKLQLKGENYGSGNNASLEIYNALNAAVKVKLNSNGDSYINGGNLGVGITLPQHKLDVGGTIRSYNYRLAGNTTNPTTTAATIYDQSSVGLTLSAHNIELRNYNGSSMVRSVFFQHNSATFTGTCTATNFILSSDETLKENIKDIDNKHIDVNWKNFELKSEQGIKRAGVIAQELETKHPEFVRTNKDGLKSVAYIDLLIAKIAELEARLEKAGI